MPAKAFTTGCDIANRAGPSLAILHRLDKETSGVLVFGKTPLANKSLTEQFTDRHVHKKYLLLTDRAVPEKEFTVKTALVRIGEKYASRPGGEIAETKFTPIAEPEFAVKSAGLENGAAPSRSPAARTRSAFTRRKAAFRFLATRFTAARPRRAFFCTRRKLHSPIRPPASR